MFCVVFHCNFIVNLEFSETICVYPCYLYMYSYILYLSTAISNLIVDVSRNVAWLNFLIGIVGALCNCTFVDVFFSDTM